ncbi:MAG: CocE/NonD family hydrolase [Candidatus Omnitrophota bacterium]|nr:alpha/beta hydrolase [Candidatus Omnitrophota bacterium]
MRKFTFLVFLSFFVIIMLFVLAFFYVDLSGRKSFLYDIFEMDRKLGTVRVDRFITEDKVIYKARTEYPASLEYPLVEEKMYLKRKTMAPQKYREETEGIKGSKRSIWLFQDGEFTDVLFSEYPRVMFIEKFETGRKTAVFSPYSIMLYMPIVDEYNFWKKGTQFFEVMIPIKEPILPMREKIGMRYIHEAYASVGGRKVEAEVYAISAKGIPETELILGKYSHEILEIGIKAAKIRITMGRVLDERSSVARIDPAGMIAYFKGMFAERPPEKKEQTKTEIEPSAGDLQSAEKDTLAKAKDVFFGSGKVTLSGKMWVPAKEEPAPAILFVPRNSVVPRGEQTMTELMGKALAASGIIMLSFDAPGQGKSQGSAAETDDEAMKKYIGEAVSYLEKDPRVKKGNITLMGYRSGGYLALKASEGAPSVSTCIVLGIPSASSGVDISKKPDIKEIERLLSSYGLGPFDNDFVSLVSKKVAQYQEKILTSEDKYALFRGMRLPIKGYKDFLGRKPYETIQKSDKPVLLLYGRDDKGLDVKADEKIKKLSKERKGIFKTGEVRSIGKYMSGSFEVTSTTELTVSKDIVKMISSWVQENQAE